MLRTRNSQVSRWSMVMGTLLMGTFAIACSSSPSVEEATPPASAGRGGQSSTRRDAGQPLESGAPNADGGVAPWDAADAKDGDASSAPAPPFLPANASAFGALPSSGSVHTLPSQASFDTDQDCASASVLGDCSVAFQPGAPAACVCRSGELSMVDLGVRGTRALVLLVNGNVTVRGVLDVAANGSDGGPGSEASTASPGSGRFDHGTANLVPLRAGEAGDGALSAGAGAGGGALQISSSGTLSIEPGASIQAGGGGAAGAIYSGANAGSGGAILLEATAVHLEGALLANGGGGGGGGDRSSAGWDGADARDAGVNPASGGSGRSGEGCALSGTTSGGGGGSGATATSAAGLGESGDARQCIPWTYVEAGGRGGGVGRIRVNTTGNTGFVTTPSAVVSPMASLGAVAPAP